MQSVTFLDYIYFVLLLFVNEFESFILDDFGEALKKIKLAEATSDLQTDLEEENRKRRGL